MLTLEQVCLDRQNPDPEYAQPTNPRAYEMSANSQYNNSWCAAFYLLCEQVTYDQHVAASDTHIMLVLAAIELRTL